LAASSCGGPAGAIARSDCAARDALDVAHQRRIAADDPYFLRISSGWGDALKKAFAALPDYALD